MQQWWVVLGVYVGLMATLCSLVPAHRHPNWFWAGLGTLIVSFIEIRWWTGEPPRWRLG
jgi:hypothetical protein